MHRMDVAAIAGDMIWQKTVCRRNIPYMKEKGGGTNGDMSIIVSLGPGGAKAVDAKKHRIMLPKERGTGRGQQNGPLDDRHHRMERAQQKTEASAEEFMEGSDAS